MVRVTLPVLAPTVPPAYSSLYEDTKAQWKSEEEDNEEVEAAREHNQSFNENLYEVVTDDIESDNVEEEEEEKVEDEDAVYHNRLEELQRKYGSKQMSDVDSEDFRFSETNEFVLKINIDQYSGSAQRTSVIFSSVLSCPSSSIPTLVSSLVSQG